MHDSILFFHNFDAWSTFNNLYATVVQHCFRVSVFGAKPGKSLMTVGLSKLKIKIAKNTNK